MTTRLPLPELIGRSAGIASLREQIRRLERISAGRLPPILILGETGSGKGLMAGLLHRSGRRAVGPFIDVNCAAIPETLLESELFGFERGAFTDARAPKQGLIEAAHHGTLFLDEIGELPDALQVKLLTAIESRQVRRLGRTRNESVDVSIIAATSTDLTAAMRARRFRRELYHRLSTVVLELPPLRTRDGDILELAEHFLARAATEHGIPEKRLAGDARAALLAYPWPGNVRELANVVERVMLLEDGPVITASMLSLLASTDGSAPEPPPVSLRSPEALRADERQQLVAAFNAAQGNITRAAARLGIHRNTMRYRLTKHELVPRGTEPSNSSERRESSFVSSSSLPTPVPAKAIRWEERPVALLGVKVVPSTEDGYIEPASLMPELIEKITSFGARIEQFTPSELMAVFGIEPMDDAPRRAVLAAHAMLQALRRVDGTRRGRFAIHLGSYLIARAGAVIGMDADARSRAAEAVRVLLRQAAPDEIIVDGSVAQFLDTRFAMEPIASDSADSFRVLGRERPRFEVGGPALSRFVGRRRDLDALLELLKRAEDGQPQIVGLVGEAGVGKSRLIFEVAHVHRVKDWLVLEAGSVAHGQATSYLPVAGLLRTYFRITDRDTQRDICEKVTEKLLALDRALEPTLPALLALLDVAVEEPAWRGLDPPERRRRMLEAVKHLLRREAQARPLLVIFEDLHWIDTETQALLNSLTESVAMGPFLLLVSYRPEYRHAWESKPNYTQLRLDPLAPESADELLSALLGRDASLDPLKRLLAETTGRNPFFIEESVRTLVETRVLGGARADYRLALPANTIQVPATVHAILAARIDRLPSADQRLLETAAVIGQVVPFALLRTIADESDGALQKRLSELQGAEFLYETRPRPDLEYSFKHALTHEVAYDGVLQERRRALHARIVGAMEALHSDRLTEQIERLGYHALRGGLSEKAVRYFRQAGEKAAARSALPEARVWFEQALGVLAALPESPATLEQGFEVRMDLAMVLNDLGEPLLARVREAEMLAEKLNDDRRRGLALARMSVTHANAGELDEALATGARAVEIAGSLGDLRLRIRTTSVLALAYLALGEYERVVTLASDDIAALPDEWTYQRLGGSTPPSIFDRYLLVQSLAALGRFAEATEYETEMLRLAERIHDAHPIGLAHQAASLLHTTKGDWARARPLIEHWIEVARAGNLVVLYRAVALSAHVLAQLGEVRGAVGRLMEGMGLVDRIPAQERLHMASAYRSLGHACVMLGRLDGARRFGDRALAFSPNTSAAAAQALHLLGDIATHPERFDPERGEVHYREALTVAQRRGMRPLVAHCHLGLGKLCRRTGKREQAQEHLTTATTMYREMGMRYWLEQAEAELK